MAYQLSASTAATAALLLQKATRQHPPMFVRQSHLYYGPAPAHQTVGAYLHALGYLTPNMIATVVYRQREQRRERMPQLFGDIAIRRSLVHPQVMTAVLLIQMIDRLLRNTNSTPKLLGEQLVLSGAVSPLQIAHAIEHQLCMRQQGRPMRLGDVLVLQSVLDRQDLETLAQQHSEAAFSGLALEISA